MIRPATDRLSFLAAAVLLCAVAGAASARTSDRNQKAHVGADASDCSINDAGPCLFTGNVRITQGTLDITAGKADVRRADGEIRTIKLNGGPAKLRQQTDDGGWVNANAAQIDYDLGKDTVVLSGDAYIQQPGRGSIAGDRIIYNMRTNQVQSGAAAGGGRVNMVFEPKNGAPADSAPKPDAGKPAPRTPPPAQDKP